ncbi:MAG: BrnT family toxin [Chloroflexi bacterium]|nr:BrnT family toxin [Chloroflexota bacterium]
MKINRVIWYEQFEEKLQVKHHVDIREAEQALRNHRRARRVKRGHVRGEDVYLALGQTDEGRYLSVFFVWKKSQDAIIISARDMDDAERDDYEES